MDLLPSILEANPAGVQNSSLEHSSAWLVIAQIFADLMIILETASNFHCIIAFVAVQFIALHDGGCGAIVQQCKDTLTALRGWCSPVARFFGSEEHLAKE